MVNMDLNKRVLVVGAGPAGARVALEVAGSGSKTTLIDKKADFGNSSSCAGLISTRTWNRVKITEKPLINSVYGARIFPPDRKSFSIKGEKVKAVVIDRDQLNRDIVNSAREAGAEIYNRTCLLNYSQGKVLLKDLATERESTLAPKITVGADGPFSTLRRSLDLPEPRKFLYGLQAVGKLPDLDSDSVEVHFGSSITPDFFAWAVPLDGARARIGLATENRKKLRPYFEHFQKVRGVKGNCSSFSAGPIPIGIPDRFSSESVLLVGDAAAQVKPSTGGGLAPGSICAKIAGKLVGDADRGDISPPTLAKKYEEESQRAIGHSLNKEMRLHNMLASLDDSSLNSALHLLEDDEIRQLLRNSGDIDRLYGTAKKALKNRKLSTALIKILPGQIRRIIVEGLAGGE